MKAFDMPQLSKRGVAVLSVLGTASVFLSLSALFKPAPPAPVPAPAPTQVIVIVVPALAVLPPAPQAHDPRIAL